MTGETSFYQIEPGGTGGVEVQVLAGSLGQQATNKRCLVSVIVVCHSRLLIQGVSGRQEGKGCEGPDDIHGDKKITHADSHSFGISTVSCR